jgi:hypothetical protein
MTALRRQEQIDSCRLVRVGLSCGAGGGLSGLFTVTRRLKWDSYAEPTGGRVEWGRGPGL